MCILLRVVSWTCARVPGSAEQIFAVLLKILCQARTIVLASRSKISESTSTSGSEQSDLNEKHTT